MGYRITSFVHIKDHKIVIDKDIVFSEDKIITLKKFLKSSYNALEISWPKFHKMDELSKLGILATDLLFRKREIPEDTALVFSNYSSSLSTDKIHQESIDQSVSPAVFVYTLPNIVMGEICIKNKIYGENSFFITDKFDAVFITNYSKSLLESSAASAIVCGWIEWNNDDYDVFLCLVTREGKMTFSAENLQALYNF